MVTNKIILSYSLTPRLTSRGTTALSGVINGMRAFVPSFSTLAEFEQAVKDDNIVLAGVNEGGAERVNGQGEKFVSQTSFTWVRKAAEPTATEKVIMQALLEKTLTREKPAERVDTALALVQGVKSRIELMREQAALAQLEQERLALVASGAASEPVII